MNWPFPTSSAVNPQPLRRPQLSNPSFSSLTWCATGIHGVRHDHLPNRTTECRQYFSHCWHEATYYLGVHFVRERVDCTYESWGMVLHLNLRPRCVWKLCGIGSYRDPRYKSGYLLLEIYLFNRSRKPLKTIQTLSKYVNSPFLASFEVFWSF